MANNGRYELVISALAYHEDNTELLGSLGTTGIPDVRTGWDELFHGKAQFGTFSHQDWVAWVRAAKSRPNWCDEWLKYVHTRYGL